MGMLNLDDIEPGMTLGRDIVNRNGLVLLKAEEQITERHLRILKMWGVTEADIKGVGKEDIEQKTAAEIDPRILEEAAARVNDLFRHADRGQPFINELARLVTLRLARRLK